MAVGGKGVARFQGCVVFVAGAAPGDRLEVEISAAKKNFCEAEILRVIEAGPARIEPPCPYFGRCGGCSWQHISYPEQLIQKRELAQSSLLKHSEFKGFFAKPVVPSPKQFRYRNRIQLHRSQSQPGRYDGAGIGFLARKSSRLVEIEDCLIADERLSAQIAQARAKASDGTLPPGERFELRLDRSESVSGFAQVNDLQNKALVSHVVELFTESARGAPPRSIWDVYSGSGNFTFPLSGAFPEARITAIELDKGATESGNARAISEGCASRVHFEASKVEDWIDSADFSRSEETFVLLDPPRIGCEPNVVRKLAEGRFPLVVYVSCHPVTLARDLKMFSQRGWRLESVAPFDLFPQTDHVETVVALVR